MFACSASTVSGKATTAQIIEITGSTGIKNLIRSVPKMRLAICTLILHVKKAGNDVIPHVNQEKAGR